MEGRGRTKPATADVDSTKLRVSRAAAAKVLFSQCVYRGETFSVLEGSGCVARRRSVWTMRKSLELISRGSTCSRCLAVGRVSSSVSLPLTHQQICCVCG